jgi:hypothetical protein
MVNVIPAAKTSTNTANTKPSVFPSLFILGTSYWRSPAATDVNASVADVNWRDECARRMRLND